MSYFIAYLKLSQILAFALRTIVSSYISCYAGIFDQWSTTVFDQ